MAEHLAKPPQEKGAHDSSLCEKGCGPSRLGQRGEGHNGCHLLQDEEAIGSGQGSKS